MCNKRSDKKNNTNNKKSTYLKGELHKDWMM